MWADYKSARAGAHGVVLCNAMYFSYHHNQYGQMILPTESVNSVIFCPVASILLWFVI